MVERKPLLLTTAEQNRQQTMLETDILADGLLTVKDAAQFLAVGRSTVYAAMETGHLAYCKIGRARRIPRRALLDFAQAHLCGGWVMQPSTQEGRGSQAAQK